MPGKPGDIDEEVNDVEKQENYLRSDHIFLIDFVRR